MPTSRPPSPPPTAGPGARTKWLIAGIVFTGCLGVSWSLASFRSADTPPVPDLPDVGARGPGAVPSFIPIAPPRDGVDRAAPPEDLTAAALAELAADQEGREEALRAAVFGLADDPTATIETRLERYREAVESALEEAGLGNLIAYRGVLIEAFLRNASVQRELEALPPGDRQSQIDRIRAEFGYDDETLARMRKVDARRDERWARGLEYMRERSRLEATFAGEPLDAELAHLRETTFGPEAPTIEREEADGFFRYERPRVYGRN